MVVLFPRRINATFFASCLFMARSCSLGGGRKVKTHPPKLNNLFIRSDRIILFGNQVCTVYATFLFCFVCVMVKINIGFVPGGPSQ
jgi:hypothetical protein